MPRSVDAHPDILDQRDPLAFPFLGSIAFHATLVGIVFLYLFWLSRPKDQLGDPNPSAGVSVGVVSKIPIPQRDAPENPVANDSQSTVRTAPAKQDTQKQALPDKTAVEIPDNTKPKKLDKRPQQEKKYLQPAPPNQIYSQTKQAVSSPMYGGPIGAGQVGIGPNSPLGNRLGWYAEIVRERLAQNWHTNGLSGQNAAIVSFTILRSGEIQDVRVLQTSGNPATDNTALRAVYDTRQLPPLPAQITESSISAQFTFSLR